MLIQKRSKAARHRQCYTYSVEFGIRLRIRQSLHCLDAFVSSRCTISAPCIFPSFPNSSSHLTPILHPPKSTLQSSQLNRTCPLRNSLRNLPLTRPYRTKQRIPYTSMTLTLLPRATPSRVMKRQQAWILIQSLEPLELNLSSTTRSSLG